MGAMDQISDDIYVGSVWSLSSLRDLKQANITHIVSLLRGDVQDMTVHGFKQLHVEIDDDDEEDIMRFFELTNKFINEATSQGTNVLVHCIAGISRSVTVATAYILRKQFETATSSDQQNIYSTINSQDRSVEHVENVIQNIKKGRSVANPNESFREQLVIYLRSSCEISPEKPLYRQWVLQKQAEGIPLTGQPPKNINYISTTQGMRKLNSNDTSAHISTERRPIIRPFPTNEARLPQTAQPLPALHSTQPNNSAPIINGSNQNQPEAVTSSSNVQDQKSLPKRLTQLRCKKCRYVTLAKKINIVSKF